MLAAPNAGSFLATGFMVSAGVISVIVEFLKGQLEMGIPFMIGYNLFDVRNPVTTYVSIAGDFESLWCSGHVALLRTNDDVVTVSSAHVLPYAEPSYLHRLQPEVEHMFIRYNTSIVDDMFPRYIAVLTAPGPRVAARVPERPPLRVQADSSS